MKIPHRTSLHALAALLCAVSASVAQTTYSWNSSSTADWSNSSLWSPNGTPGAADIIGTPTAFGTLRVNSDTGNNAYAISLGGTSGWSILAGTAGTSTAQRTYTLTIGAGGITNSGSGTLLFRDNNAYNHLALSTSTLTVSSGSIAFGSSSSQALSAVSVTGATSISSGTSLQIWANSATFAGGINLAGTATLNIFTASSGSGGITAGGLSGTSGTVRTSNSGSTSGKLTIDIATGSKSFGGTVINGNGSTNSLSLEKTGSGTQTLSGANTYSGGTIISAGTLLVANTTGSGLGTGAVAVNGGRLGGTGIIALASNPLSVGSGATLLGGDGTSAAGTLSINNAVSLSDGSLISLVLGAGGAHSSIARTGSQAWAFDSDQAFSFINAGVELGTYAGLITGLAADPGVGSWTIANEGWSGQFSYSNGSVNLEITAVPEPAVSALLGLAGVFIVVRRRRQNAASFR